ncbi:MAG: DUF3008 family protein [Thermodesulfobacteriota bacterium]|nr:DUF3008 family protein [Thermodesulfobacteriota bacterium]
MPAESKKQRKAAGIATAIQEGKMKSKPRTASAEMAQMAPSSLRDFATTPEKALPPVAAAKKPAGGMGPTRVTKTGVINKKAF